MSETLNKLRIYADADDNDKFNTSCEKFTTSVVQYTLILGIGIGYWYRKDPILLGIGWIFWYRSNPIHGAISHFISRMLSSPRLTASGPRHHQLHVMSSNHLRASSVGTCQQCGSLSAVDHNRKGPMWQGHICEETHNMGPGLCGSDSAESTVGVTGQSQAAG